MTRTYYTWDRNWNFIQFVYANSWDCAIRLAQQIPGFYRLTDV